MTLTKKDLVLAVAKQTGITQVDVKRVVQRTLDHLVESLKEGKTIELRNFGVFAVKRRKARKARNPRTGEEVHVPAKNVATFKPGFAP